MASINRFMQPVAKDYSWQTPELQVWEPNYNQWLDVLEKQQQTYNTASEIEGLIPKHIPEDVTDVQAYTQGIQSDIQKVRDTFAAGDIAAGNRMLRETTSKVKRDWQPGGRADMFQQRLTKFQEVDKMLQETYLDPKSKQYAPELYKYYKKRIGIQPYKTDTGYGTIDRPTTYQYFTPEDWTKHIDTVLDNISADAVALKPELIPSGMSLKEFFKTGKKEHLDKSKVLDALVGSVPPEMLKSLQIYSEATGIDAADAVQKMLDSAATGKAFEKFDVDYKEITDDYEMEKHRSKLRREEKKEEIGLNDLTLRTQIYNSQSGMPDWDVFGASVADNGKVITKQEEQYLKPNFRGAATWETKIVEKPSNIGFKDWVYQENVPIQIKNIASKFAKEMDGMSDKQAYDFIKQKYDEKQSMLSSTDALIHPYDEKERKIWSEYLLGTTQGKEGATAGAMFLNDMTATTIMPGDMQTTTGRQLGRTMGLFDSDGRAIPGALKHYVENAVVSEEIDVPSGEMPSGHKVSYVDRSGKVWSFLLGPRSLEEEALNSDAYKINQVKKNDALDHVEFQPTHPILRQYFPNGIEVDSKDVYQSDVLFEQWKDAFAKKSPTAPKLRNKYDSLKENPYDDTFMGKDVRIIDPTTKQPVPILDDDGNPVRNEDGTIRYWMDSDINKLTRNTTIKSNG